MSGARRLRETDIRPEALMDEQARRYAADVAWLVERRDRFVAVPCPACGGTRAEPHWRKYDLEYPRCLDCGTTYMNPRPEPDLLDEYYRRSTNYAYWNEIIFPASEAARREKIFAPRARRTMEIIERHGGRTGSLLDVGAGFGTFAEEIFRTGAFGRVVALEPEPNLAQTCRDKGLEVLEQPIESTELEPGSFDVVSGFEVLEHLFAPRDFLEHCARLLAPGGLVVVTCPNGQGFDIETLGELSTTVDAEHVNYLHPQSLAKLLGATGFDVVECGTPGRLDAELVRKQALAGTIDLSSQPLLRRILVEDWDRLGEPFQDFLAENGLSSNMWLVGRLAG